MSPFKTATPALPLRLRDGLERIEVADGSTLRVGGSSMGANV